MIYQLAKTSVGLSGQVKWDMVINASKVVDLQIVPIHEDISFNYTKREDTLNYTHIQNLQRLYKKIPSKFFEPVADPKFTTGYPIRNNGIRMETHEHTYTMGMKRNRSYQRYNKQFSFFCPIWCDDISEMNNIVFKIVVENDVKDRNDKDNFNKGEVICSKTIDHSLIKEYLNQYMLSTNLNSDLIYISFAKHESWITGVNVEDGVVQTENTLGLIEDLTSIERPMMEVDNMLLNQFAKRKMIAPQLFNFNFEFNLGDIIIPELVHDFSGSKVNVFVDCYVKDNDGNLTKVPFRDIYSNYENIPRYDISKNKYIGSNCLDYLKDYANIDLVGQNKVVQNTFHWTLEENNKYLFNVYDGCCPVYTDSEGTRFDCKGMYFDTPDTSITTYDKMKNPLGWIKPYIAEPGATSMDIALQVRDTILGGKKEYGVRFSKDTKGEFFWLNDVKYKNELPKIDPKSNEIKRLDDLEVYMLYFPKAFFEREEMRRTFENIANIQDAFHPQGTNKAFFSEHLIGVPEGEIPAYLTSPYKSGGSFYTIAAASGFDGEFDTLIFVLPDNRENATTNYLDNDAWNENFLVSNIIDGFSKKSNISNADWKDSLMKLTYRTIRYPEGSSASQEAAYEKNVYGAQGYANDTIKTFMWRSIRTLVDNLSNIVRPEVIPFYKSLIPETVDRPEKLCKWLNDKSKENLYYKADEFSYVLRYDGKLSPFFIGGKDPRVYNFVYITKQYNSQIHVKDNSDSDMSDFNTYANTKFSPIYPSIDYFALRKKRCKYGIYHRGSRRYYWEKSWFKKNSLFVLPEVVNLSHEGSDLSDSMIKSKLYNFLKNRIRWDLRGNKGVKKGLIFDNFIFPLYDYSYTFDYKDNKTIDNYVYKIKYTLK